MGLMPNESWAHFEDKTITRLSTIFTGNFIKMQAAMLLGHHLG